MARHRNPKTTLLSRRTVLKGLGVSCALPYLEAMAATGSTAPKRMVYAYFPNGASLPEEDEYRQWRWFPNGEGEHFEFTNVLQSLEPYRRDLSVIGGLSHPKSRQLLGHIAGDTWLTGGDLRGAKYLNSISADQIAAQELKKHTRYPSLALSCDGGVGYKSRVSTLSFDNGGRPIPSENNQRAIFERYFSPDNGSTTAERRNSLYRNQKIVDLVLDDSKRLKQSLGQQDQYKVDEYLASLNTVEEQIQRNERWLDIPMKSVDTSHIDLDVGAGVDPVAYIRSMYDLIVLALQTDLTRVVTYMIAREDGMGLGEAFPKIALGMTLGHHAISHDKKTGHWEEWGRYDQWLSEQFAYFLDRLENTDDEHGPLLDSTMVLYGSACSTTHDAINYPLILAGGRNMGLKHGSYHRFEHEQAMSRLLISMLNAAGVETHRFADEEEGLPVVFS